MSEKLILIDGHSILNRAFYGVPDLTNAEGIHTNANKKAYAARTKAAGSSYEGAA